MTIPIDLKIAEIKLLAWPYKSHGFTAENSKYLIHLQVFLPLGIIIEDGRNIISHTNPTNNCVIYETLPVASLSFINAVTQIKIQSFVPNFLFQIIKVCKSYVYIAINLKTSHYMLGSNNQIE